MDVCLWMERVEQSAKYMLCSVATDRLELRNMQCMKIHLTEVLGDGHEALKPNTAIGSS